MGSPSSFDEEDGMVMMDTAFWPSVLSMVRTPDPSDRSASWWSASHGVRVHAVALPVWSVRAAPVAQNDRTDGL